LRPHQRAVDVEQDKPFHELNDLGTVGMIEAN
jgi:hypothetical protein